MSTYWFVDSNHAGDKTTSQSMTRILITCNCAPIILHNKRKNGVATLDFGLDFTVLKNAAELIAALRYKLRVLGLPIYGPTDIFCDNEAVHKNLYTPESQLRKKHHSISYHMAQEAMAIIPCCIAKEDTSTKLEDFFTKVLPRPRQEYILNKFTYWELRTKNNSIISGAIKDRPGEYTIHFTIIGYAIISDQGGRVNTATIE